MTSADLAKATAIVVMCYRDPTGSFRENIANQIALLLAELRKVRKGK